MASLFSKVLRTSVIRASPSLFRKASPVYSNCLFYSAKKFTESHEWLEFTGDVATVGITKHAASSLGEIVYAELPEVGLEAIKGDGLVSVESVKAVGEVYSPINGKVVEINSEIESDYAIISESPESDGWLCKIAVKDIKDAEKLMDEESYKNFLKTQE